MKIIRVFPRKTSYTPIDELAFVGDPPLLRPKADEVHVSCTFTWDIQESKRLMSAWHCYYPKVILGGPAFSDYSAPYKAGMYVKKGVTFTTRGCNNQCPWCLVPNREGKLREIKYFEPGWIIQDNNLLQASRKHIENVLAMLRTINKPAKFAGGLQASLISDWFAYELSTMKIESVFLAADTPGSLKPLEKALDKLKFLGRRQKQVYSMIGYKQSIEEAESQLQEIWDMGAMPFAQLYQPPDEFKRDYSANWRALQRKWSRPAAMFASAASHKMMVFDE